MRILGLSSATKVISVGLIDGDKVLVDATVPDIHSEMILSYMEEAWIKSEQIEGIAVADGPGSYSGLRGGLAVAKSLAHTLKVPIVGVSTLEAIAYNLVDKEGTIAVLLDAKRDEYNLALFKASQGELIRLTDDSVIKLEDLDKKLANIYGKVHLVGTDKGIQADPCGINVARLGLLKIKAGETVDPLSMVPKYSHKPNIREFHQSH